MIMIPSFIQFNTVLNESQEDAYMYIKALLYQLTKNTDINISKYKEEELIRGMLVELEHGSMYGQDTDITSNDPMQTLRIAMAHLEEDPCYYTKLKQAFPLEHAPITENMAEALSQPVDILFNIFNFNNIEDYIKTDTYNYLTFNYEGSDVKIIIYKNHDTNRYFMDIYKYDTDLQFEVLPRNSASYNLLYDGQPCYVNKHTKSIIDSIIYKIK